MIIRRRRAAACLAGALAAGLGGLAGCATPVADAGGPWTSGRLNLRVDALAERPAQSLTAGFELRGGGQRGQLRLLSPLGTQLASATWAPGSARLVSSQGAAEFASLDELSQHALGEALPLAALPDWLNGRAWPEAPAVTTAAGFDQLGWQIGLQRWADGFVEARRMAAPAVVLRVQLDRGG